MHDNSAGVLTQRYTTVEWRLLTYTAPMAVVKGGPPARRPPRIAAASWAAVSAARASRCRPRPPLRQRPGPHAPQQPRSHGSLRRGMRHRRRRRFRPSRRPPRLVLHPPCARLIEPRATTSAILTCKLGMVTVFIGRGTKVSARRIKNRNNFEARNSKAHGKFTPKGQTLRLGWKECLSRKLWAGFFAVLCVPPCERRSGALEYVDRKSIYLGIFESARFVSDFVPRHLVNCAVNDFVCIAHNGEIGIVGD